MLAFRNRAAEFLGRETRKYLPWLCALGLVFGPSSAYAADIFVDAVNGDDVSGDGNRGNPWRTITQALSVASGPRDVIRVAPGTYDTALGESLPLTMRSGVSIVSREGFRQTRIQGPGVASGGDGSDGPFRPVASLVLDTDVQSIYNFTEIIIPSGVRVEARGSQPLIMRVIGDVLIEGVLELSGSAGEPGVEGDGTAVAAGGISGAGGGAGGNSNDPAGSGPTEGLSGGAPSGTNGGGQGGQRSTVLAGGGGGGGHVAMGQSDVGGTSGQGGQAYGDNNLTVLFGGSGGGAGGNGAQASPDVDDTGGGGGGAGGALFIDARGVVTISGRVKAEGGPGGAGAGDSGGGGGASGGSIRISGVEIIVSMDARVLARGGSRGEGGEGGGRSGGDGSDGRIRFEDRDASVDLSQAFVQPSAIVDFLAPSTAPDLVVFPGGQSFDSDVRLVGLTLAGGLRGILVNASTSAAVHRPTIRGNALINCEIGAQFRGSNGGVASPLFASNYLHDNRVGIDVAGNAEGTVLPFVTNNTITINGIGYSVDPAFTGTGFSALQNCLVWQNGRDLMGLGSAEVVNCNITEQDFVGQNGNTSIGPRFVDKAARDLRLDPVASPLVDLGNVNAVGVSGFDPDGEVRDYDIDGDGIRQPDIGADEAGLERFMRRYGEVNGRLGRVEDVLFLNGSAGSSSRRQITIGRRVPFSLTLNTSGAGPSVAPYVLYAFLGVADNNTLSPLPLELGTMTFGIPLVGQTDGVFTLVNNVIHPLSKASLGCGLLQELDAPTTIDFNRGVGARISVTFQGLLVDSGAENRQATVTNALVVTFQ